MVPNEIADCYLFVNIDVFGTIRSRTELQLLNQEKLAAETKLEYFAVDKNNNLLISPKSSSYSADYQENYLLWTGPIAKNKNIKEAEKLLVDFSDVAPYGKSQASSLQNSFHQETTNTQNLPSDETLRARGIR